MPFCPKCGREIKEPANYCPNCSFPVADLFKEVEGSQNIQIAAATPSPAVKESRVAPITAAAILCFIIGLGDLVLGFGLFGIAAGLAGKTIDPSLPASTKVMLDLGLSFGAGTGLVLVFLAALHLLGWYWLWGGKIKGGVLGIISGIIDMAAVFLGIMWLLISILPTLGLSIVAVPFIIPALVVVSIMGVIMIIMIAIGWKTLK